MKRTLILLTSLLLTSLAAVHGQPPHPPVVDISGETERHVIIAQGTETDWQGHPHTLLLPDGKTMFCVWQGRQDGTGRHGAPGGLLKRSNDGGQTWSELLDVPANWKQIGRGSPTIHRLVDAKGSARLFVYCRDEKRTTFLHAMSEDEGKTWSPLQPLRRSSTAEPPITGWTAPISILEARGPGGRRKHLMWYERGRDGKSVPGVIWQSASYDGGLTWGESKPVVDKAGASEPTAIRSPDGKQILLLIREQNRQLNSLFSISNDEGETWSAPKELPLFLTGDRHLARYAPDGRLVIVFRPVPPLARGGVDYKGLRGVKDSHFTAWVGRYEDLVTGEESGYLVKLLHSHAGGDHTYPGLELLPDGIFIATTYIKYREGPEMHSVVSVRFRLAETDARKAGGQGRQPNSSYRSLCPGPLPLVASLVKDLTVLEIGSAASQEHLPATGSPQNTWSETKAEKLYNGIVLPEVWPPAHYDPASPEPMPVPYLEHPPAVIPIDVGRQLFVDDFLVAETTLTRTYHKPDRYAANPVLKAETPQEVELKARVGLQQGGVFYRPELGRFEMFYHSGTLDPRRRHLAFSHDLIHWERPDFGLGFGNLIREPGPDGEAIPPNIAGSVFAVWLDAEAADPAQRYKLLSYFRGHKTRVTHGLHTSPDGVHWSHPVPAGHADDAQSLFYNPFRRVWVYSIKRSATRDSKRLRARWYAESPEFLRGGNWDKAVYWTCADRLDPPEPAGGYPAHPVRGEACQLYALHAVAYESILLGLHEIHRGPENDVCQRGRFPKLTDLELGYSRDGFHWHRPDRSGFIRGTRREGDWDRAYLHGTTSILVIHQDRLVFPYSGYSGFDPNGTSGIYNGGAIGIATLRRDGFASMDAGAMQGTLTTRRLIFSGSHLFVNLKAPEGELRVEALDEDGKILATSHQVTGDKTLVQVGWEDRADLSALAGQRVRFRFLLTNGSLFAFWVSRDESGRSDGYVAGGGPGYPETLDTVGRTALRH